MYCRSMATNLDYFSFEDIFYDWPDRRSYISGTIKDLLRFPHFIIKGSHHRNLLVSENFCQHILLYFIFKVLQDLLALGQTLIILHLHLLKNLVGGQQLAQLLHLLL